MKCFDVVKTVLDETYGAVPGKEPARDASIKKALAAMSEQYTNNLMTDGGPNFNDAATRFGYVYQHVPAHAYWLYLLLEKCPEAIAVLEKGKARITCIGGGPGSEIVGFLKLLDEREIKCKLFCELIDGCDAWKATWDDLAYQLDLDEALHTTYVIHDVGNKATWSSPSQISKADIIVLSFFVSEIYHLPTAKEYVTKMLTSAKSGALLLINDNRTKLVYELVEAIATKAGFSLLASDEGKEKIWDSGEDKDMLKKYTAKFGTSTKLTGQIAWRTFQKD
jgi:hypothetical protein